MPFNHSPSVSSLKMVNARRPRSCFIYAARIVMNTQTHTHSAQSSSACARTVSPRPPANPAGIPERRARTCSRLAAKCSRHNGPWGASTDSSNHASNSPFTAHGFLTCRLHARHASLTKSTALGLTPARTCSATNASTSSASMIYVFKPCLDSASGSINHLGRFPT